MNNKLDNKNYSLQHSVTSALVKYLKDLDGETPCNLYDMVMSEIEKPLFSTIMDHCDNNQSKAAICLGINRGTLRKKLKQYEINP